MPNKKKEKYVEFICETCSSNFDRKSKLETHKIKNPNCILNRYMTKDSNKNYNCIGTSCQYKTSNNSNFRKHLLRCDKALSSIEQERKNPPTFIGEIRKSKNEYVSHIYSEVMTKIDDSGNECPFVEFMFMTVMDNNKFGLKNMVKLIYLNEKYEENINKHLESKKYKKIIVYRGNDKKDIVRFVGDDSDDQISQILDQLVKIIVRIKNNLFFYTLKQRQYGKQFDKFIENVTNNKDEFITMIYKVFFNNKETTKQFKEKYEHLIK